MLLAMVPSCHSARLASRIAPEILLLMHLLLLIINCQAQSYLDQNSQYPTCFWTQLRVAPVRDVLYIDGGNRYFQAPDGIESFPGEMLSAINFTISFDIYQNNLTELFTTVPGNEYSDYYYSGFMFADDFQFYTYGGLASPVMGNGTSPPADFVYGYSLFPDPTTTDVPVLGPFSTTLPKPVTRYITDGAGVSVPSEKLAFYFGGMTASPTLFDSGEAQLPSNHLIQMDMSVQGAPNASMKTLPAEVISRADGQLLWLPVSSRGLLVVFGGVVNPENLFFDRLNASQVTESERISPSFMSTIHLYDIASDAWYSQDIVSAERPGQLSGFCAVVANEGSKSSYEIFVYGGYNGISGANVSTGLPSNDVWVLSVPSFTWTGVSDGNETGGRFFHSCVTAYPEQMWVIGGQDPVFSPCLDSIIKVFNLNSLVWQDTYDPSVYDSLGYRRPKQVLQTIKDAESSGAIVNGAPSSIDPKLRTLFTTPYEGEITVFYPYAEGPSTASIIKQTLSGWFGGILGIVSYLLLSTICVIVIIVTRRRMLLRRCGATPSVSDGASRSRLVRWMNNMQLETKAKDVNDDTEEWRGMMETIFYNRRKSDSKRERLLRGRDEKSPSHGEAYELRSRRLDGVGYTHIPMNQEGESPTPS